jgi:hypothetical protein
MGNTETYAGLGLRKQVVLVRELLWDWMAMLLQNMGFPVENKGGLYILEGVS